MNQYIKSSLLGISITLCSSTFILANAAKKPGPVPQSPLPPPVHTVGEVRDAIIAISDIDGAPDNCEVEKVFLASGAQNYRSDGSTFNAIGPFADLYSQDPQQIQDFDLVEELNNSSGVNEDMEILFDKTTLVGTHYKGTEILMTSEGPVFRAAPVWEFDQGRVIARMKLTLDSPDGYIDWLNVLVADGKLLPTTHTYNRVFRVLTIGGVAPVYHGQEGATVGSPYTTIYVVVDCDDSE